MGAPLIVPPAALTIAECRRLQEYALAHAAPVDAEGYVRVMVMAPPFTADELRAALSHWRLMEEGWRLSGWPRRHRRWHRRLNARR